MVPNKSTGPLAAKQTNSRTPHETEPFYLITPPEANIEPYGTEHSTELKGTEHVYVLIPTEPNRLTEPYETEQNAAACGTEQIY